MSAAIRSCVVLLVSLCSGVSLLALCPSGSHAEAEPVRIVYADTVRVSASKTRSRLAELSTSASVVLADQIRLGTARAMQDVLAPVPGMHVLDLSGTGAGGAVEARGFAAQGTTSGMLVLVDGMAINDPESGRVDWNIVAPSQVERVEVLRGPSSFLYGSSTLAGLVNIVTVSPATGASSWGEVSGGSFGRGSAAGGGAWNSTRARGSLSGSFANEEGERDNSRSKLFSGAGSLTLTMSPVWNLTTRLLGSDGDRRIPGPLSAPGWIEDPETTQSADDHRRESAAQGDAELTGQLSPQLTLTAVGGGSLRHVKAFETIIPVGGLGRTSRMRGAHTEVRAHWMPQASAAPALLVGVEARAGRLESRYAENDPDRDPVLAAADVARTTGAAYAVFDKALGAGVSVQAGGRVDWTRSRADDPFDGAPVSENDDQRAVSPSLALRWAVPGAASAWVSYAGAFKTPELEQLYDPRPYDLGFGPLRISNNTLQAQRDDHWDVGTRARVGPAWVDGSAYYARSRNELGFDYANFRLSNIARSKHAGFEGQVSMLASSGLSGSASYAYTRATFEGGDFDGRQINTVPKHQIFLRASFAHRAKGSASVELQNVSGQWIDEANTQELPDYTLVNIGVRQQVGALELFGSVRNVANERYATVGYVTLNEVGDPLPLYFPAAGRSFSVGLRLASAR